MRQTNLTCDYCTTEMDIENDEDIFNGWISVERYDTIREEVIDNDFCSVECLVSYFS